jgi:hypothetical protein
MTRPRLDLALFACGLLTVAPIVSADELGGTCVSCHAKEEDEELSEPVGEWKQSVHHAVEVSCDSCHGGNPFEEDADLSMDEENAGYLGSPGWSEVAEFCGACHETIHESFSQGALGQRLAAGEQVAVCTTCHGAHEVRSPAPREILTEDRCGECSEFEPLVAPMEDAFIEAERALDDLRGAIDISVVEAELHELHEDAILHVHTYDRPQVEEMASLARARLGGIAQQTQALVAEVRFRRTLGVGLVSVLLVAGIAPGRSLSAIGRRRRSRR